MRAIVHLTRDGGRSCSAKTDNDLGIVFSVVDGTLALGDELDIDLTRVFEIQRLRRVNDGRVIAIRMGQSDVHDLRVVPAGHGIPSAVTLERMLAP